MFGCTIMGAILPIRKWRYQGIDQVGIDQTCPTLWDHFYLSVFSSTEVLSENACIWSKLPTVACWSREEKRGRCEANLLYVKSDFGTIDKLQYSQYSSPIEALKFIVESKSLPVELDNLTTELHVLLRQKKSL